MAQATATQDGSLALYRLISEGADVVVVREGAGLSDAIALAWPERVLDLPMADRAAVSVGAGLAMAGRRVVVEIADAARLPALIEALREVGPEPLALVLRAPYLADGASALVGAPVLDLLAGAGVEVVTAPMASSGAQLARLVEAGRPAVLLETVDGAGDDAPLAEGGHVLIVTPAGQAEVALEAAGQLAGEGIGATVFALATLWPVPAAVGERLRQIGRLVVVTPRGEAAWGRRVAAVGLDAAFLYLEAPLSVVEGNAGDIVSAARAAVHF